VPAGDIGVGGREIGYLFGAYKKLRNEFTGVLTGKGLGWGGSLIRPEATGYGCVYFAEEMLATRGRTLDGKTCLVSGSGNVAQFTVEKLLELGAKPVTLSDSSGYVYDECGIDREKLAFVMELKNQRRGRLAEYVERYPEAVYTPVAPGGDRHPIWSHRAECAFPSATENEIRAHDAETLLAGGLELVCEGSNMAADRDAVDRFLDARVLFAPGKAANAGGVATSGLEMAQNSMRYAWTRDEVDSRLRVIMKGIHELCLTTAERFGAPGNYVDGANIAGFLKVADAMIDQGWCELTAPFRTRRAALQELQRWRIHDVLLVARPYDRYLLEEAGELAERLHGEFRSFDLEQAPDLTGVDSGAEALALAEDAERFQLLIVTPQLADMSAADLVARLRARGSELPVVLLAQDARELEVHVAAHGLAGIARAFLWQGDARILLAIVKSIEDWHNAAADVGGGGVPAILLVEDQPRHYSSLLPALYAELLALSERVVREGPSGAERALRQRARPKILLCTSYEEAERAFAAWGDELLGVIADVEFPRAGALAPDAGAELARRIRTELPDVPVVLCSSQAENEELARALGAAFLRKGSHLLLAELHRLMLDELAFGDFVFRLPDGREVDRAADLAALEERLARAPLESIVYHATRNHFSRWLKARTALVLAEALRPRRPEEFASPEALRAHLVAALAEHRREQRQRRVSDFDRESFDPEDDFRRLGGGSIGGKARGLAFVRRLLAERGLRRRFGAVELFVPPAVVVATEVFDRVLDRADLRRFAIECEDDEELRRRFAAARLPAGIERDLAALLARTREPLAVRSSSLLEDSRHQPLTGVYVTRMVANDDPDEGVRLADLLAAIRAVYASAFARAAKRYLRATTHRLEEERMAVLVQPIVGARHGERFYPTLSGVARSINVYPSGPMRAEDGIVALALGLGRTIVEGEPCLRFCSRYPRHVPQLASPDEALRSTQRDFWALRLGAAGEDAERELRWPLAAAESDGELAPLASTYSEENDTLSDGVARPGVRLLTFAPLLRDPALALPEVLTTLLDEGAHAMGLPVEIEFALQLAGGRARLGLLQMRPLELADAVEPLALAPGPGERVLCRSLRALGHGRFDGIADVLMVDPATFERGRSREAAAEIGRLNAELVVAGRSYLLVGVGRFGSRDPWLGLPLGWEEICGARVLVEAGLRQLAVEPSQGSHFFHNLMASKAGFLTVDETREGEWIDWRWLAAQPARSERDGVRHLRLGNPLAARIDGRRGEGAILVAAGGPAGGAEAGAGGAR
jgi:glutamate dehydrogenase/leucine dehydrogenase/CheY-like chemotaxis protein